MSESTGGFFIPADSSKIIVMMSTQVAMLVKNGFCQRF